MKKALLILSICSLLLTSCGQIDDAESKPETTTTTAVESSGDAIESTSAKEEKDTSEAATTALKTSSQTVSSSSSPTNTAVTTTKKSGSSNANGNSNQVQNNNGQGNNHQPAQNDPQPDNSPSNDPQSNNGAEQNNRPSDNNQNNTSSPPVTTAKPAVTNPPAAATTKPQTADQKPDVITTTDPHVQDITSLNSFVQDIDTGYYQNIGKSFGSFETDYQKAKAIFDWEIDNGNGSCISYAIQTYYLCKGAGLECAYAFMTSNGWYGHVYNVVNADGNWYVFDTQGECFLGSDYIYTKIFDENENTLNITLSENDY